MSFVGNVAERLTGKQAAKDARRAADTQAAAQQRAIDFTRGATDPIRDIGFNALQSLAAGYGIGDGPSFYQQAADDPFTRQLIDQGLEGAATTAAATGGLRGGNFQSLSARIAPSIIQQQAAQRAAGLSGLSGHALTGVDSIASQIAGIGQTQAQGITAASQAKQTALGQALQLGGQAFGAYALGGGFGAGAGAGAAGAAGAQVPAGSFSGVPQPRLF